VFAEEAALARYLRSRVLVLPVVPYRHGPRSVPVRHATGRAAHDGQMRARFLRISLFARFAVILRAELTPQEASIFATAERIFRARTDGQR